MSTPTTATATLPPYRPHQPHLSHTLYHQQAIPSFRPVNALLPSAPRLPPVNNNFSSSSSHTTSNGISYSAASSSTRPGTLDSPTTTNLPPGVHPIPYPSMPSTQAASRADQSSNRKRRRSREPDWGNFYKNGLPKEVIVIDDTPEPETAVVNKSTALNGRENGLANGSATESAARQPAKRRKREDETSTHYDPVHNNFVGSQTNTPHRNGSNSHSTVSSDWTNIAVPTTAATSLGSLSSNGQYDYEAQVGQKRKRTTRGQLASEARRREAALSDAFPSYRPPPHPPKKAGEVTVRVIHDNNPKGRFDDDDGHYLVVPEADLTDRYQMIKLLGQGTFGKVVQAKDRRRGKFVAIKIIRSVQKYRDASKIELRVLQTLKANDEENRNRCIHLRDCFDFRGHICIVMDLLGQSVFDFLKSNNFVPFPNSQIQNFARQLLTSVAFLHDLNLIHTDLKPENILLCNNEYQTFTYNRKIPSSSSSSTRQASQRKVLLDTEIRLIDFGSATFQEEYHSSVVSTRHYRAPEIILGLGWSYPCDIWSIGCILVEFFTGDALFQTHDNLEHLAMMEAVVGARIDTTLVHQVNRATRSGGNPASKYFKRLKLDYPTAETTRASRRFVKFMKRLEDIIPASNKFLILFLDLLRKIFVYDPAKRIKAKDALAHPWFKEPAIPDDGSEAARIRLERMRQQAAEANGTRLPPMHRQS